jgi:6-pyruvoyltetrahydropterin/6-carboxytetrahydropterin synthase
MQGKMASTENIAIEMWKILYEPIKEISKGNGILHKLVHLYETPRNFVEYYGEE